MLYLGFGLALPEIDNFTFSIGSTIKPSKKDFLYSKRFEHAFWNQRVLG
jgi:hypothetical protein